MLKKILRDGKGGSRENIFHGMLELQEMTRLYLKKLVKRIDKGHI